MNIKRKKQQEGTADFKFHQNHDITSSDKIDFDKITSLRIINGKVPVIEIEWKEPQKAKPKPEPKGGRPKSRMKEEKVPDKIKTRLFSMLSDCNSQEFLVQMKRFKHLGLVMKV